MKFKSVLLSIMTLMFIFLVAVGCAANNETNDKADSEQTTAQKPEEKPEIGFSAPTFTIADLNNQNLDTSKLNKPAILNFWATWCPSCQAETPEFEALYKQYKDDVQFLPINLTSYDKEEDVKKYIESFKTTYPIYMDREGKVMELYRVVSTPTMYIVDHEGIIVKKIVGPIGGEGDQSVDSLKKLLDELVLKTK